MRFLQHNWQIKIIALTLAMILHLYVRKQQDVLGKVFQLPVTIATPAGQHVVEPSSSFRVRVEVAGPSELIRSIQSDDFTLQFDTSSVRPGKHREVPVEVVLPERYRNQVELDWKPRRIPVKFLADFSKQLQVVVKPLNRLDGWQLKETLRPNPSAVTVSGTEEQLARVVRIVAPLTLEETQQVNSFVTLQALDADGQNITDLVHVEPLQVNVSGMQQRVVVQKRVPVQPLFGIPAGKRVASVEVIPWRVLVTGTEGLIRDLYYLETSPLRVPADVGEVTQEVAITPPRGGAIKLTPQKVKVTVIFESIGPPSQPGKAPAGPAKGGAGRTAAPPASQGR